MTEPLRDHDIALVGMSCLFPGARDVRHFWSNIVNGVDAIRDVPADRWPHIRNFDLPAGHEARLACSRGGFFETPIHFDVAKYGIMPNIVRDGDPEQFLMIKTIDEALADAGVAFVDPVRERTDVVIGRGGYVTHKMTELAYRAETFEVILEVLERKYPEMLAGRRDEVEQYLRSTLPPNSAETIGTGVSNITASRAANRLNLRGAAYVVDAACSSSLMAVETAVTRLRAGMCDLAVAGGAFLFQTPTFWHVFTRIGAISPSGQIRPLDRRADGLVVGEGCGAVILKRWADACRDGDRVYAVLRGCGSSSDGRQVDVLAPASEGQLRALQRAYADAGVSPDSIGLLETHGTGTPVGDVAELETVRTFYGTQSQPATGRAIGSVKSMIGHTMPAAGMASLIKIALALNNKILPPTLHCEEPHPLLADASFYVNPTTRPWVRGASQGPRRAGANTFGFGGINAHVVLEETPQPSTKTQVAVPRDIIPAVARETELAVFSGATLPDLLANVRRTVTFLDQDAANPLPAEVARATTRGIVASHAYKLAVVFENLPKLRELLDVCLTQLAAETPDFKAHEAIYYSAKADKPIGKIAYILPGMGFPGLIGNYPDHLLELCLHYPEVRAEFDFFEDRDRHPDDTVPTSSIFCPPLTLPEAYRQKLKQRLAPPKLDKHTISDDLPEERYLAAMGVTLANWVGWTLLRKFEVPLDMLAGQSQGEMAALCAAGVSDFHETAPRFWKIVNINPRYSVDERLCFAWTQAEKVEALIAQRPGTYIAIYMAPEAIIFGGPSADLDWIGDQLRKEHVLVQQLPYPPIHTPCLSYMREEFDQAISNDELNLQTPKVALYSSILAAPYPTEPEEIRQTLMLNLDHPLRVWQTIRRMYDDGARIYVQVGGGHMAAHMKMLLPAGAEVVTAALDTDVRNPLTQLNHLCATLFTAGVPFRFDPLFEYRRVADLSLDAPRPAPVRPRSEFPVRLDWTPAAHPNVPAAAEPVSAPIESLPTPPAADMIAPMPLLASDLAVEAAPAPAALVEVAAPAVAEPQPELHAEPEVAGWDAAEATGMPLLGTVVELNPDQNLVMRRRYDLEKDLFLKDHLFVYAERVKPLVNCLPIVPMTMSVELVAESAALLAPGLGLIGFEGVRAKRWIGMRDCTTIDIEVRAQVVSHDPETDVRRIAVDVYFEDRPSFSAVALFSSAYRQDMPFELGEVQSDKPWPFTSEDVYPKRLMFHGPSFRVVSGLHALDNPVCTAELCVLPKDGLFADRPNPVLLTDPCLNDGFGQLVGLWCHTNEWYVLPTGVDKIEIYGPTPPVGSSLPVRMEVTEFNLDLKQIHCNIEIGDGQGGVWMRLRDWSDWIFKWPRNFAEYLRDPYTYTFGEEISLPGLPAGAVAVCLSADDLKKADLDWSARLILHLDEMPEADLEDKKRKCQLLGSRAAIKDAARLWWVRRHGGTVPHPAELFVAHDPLGRPYLAPADNPELPRISLSHSESFVVAIASDAPIGIDVEPLGRDTESILTTFAADEEIELVRQMSARFPEEFWTTRLWCAKEAASKALGTGFQGRPKDFQALDVDEAGGFLILHRPTGQKCIAQTTRLDEHLAATATLAVPEPAHA